MEAKDALKHWSSWGRDNGGILPSGSPTCTSFERMYVKNPERYGWPVDREIASAFKYDLKTAEKVEKVLTACLSKTELRVLVCCEVYGYALTYEVIARRLHMPKASLETFRLTALNKFRRCWNG